MKCNCHLFANKKLRKTSEVTLVQRLLFVLSLHRELLFTKINVLPVQWMPPLTPTR
jgi:hypothetical protein